MLNTVNLDDKTYDQLMEEALTQIPLYSKEWTNFNISDPGITTIENLTGLSLIQQNAINTVSDAVKLKLLKLVGYEPEKDNCSRVFVRCKSSNINLRLPINQKFYVGDTCFETNKEISVSNRNILGVYQGNNTNNILDISSVINSKLPFSTYLFTEKPEKGMFIDIVVNKLPEKSEEFKMYVEIDQPYKRNKFEENQLNIFAELKWQILSENGFVDIDDNLCTDNTCGFVISGDISIKIPDILGVTSNVYKNNGYIIRCILEKANYDIPPKVKSLNGFLFDLYQKDSKAITYTASGNEEIVLFGELLNEELFSVYCREDNNQVNVYHQYFPIDFEATDEEMQMGRYYKYIKLDNNKYKFIFNNKKSEFSPSKDQNTIKIVCYNEEMSNLRVLGKIYGYDNQILSINQENIYTSHFSLLVENETVDGEKIYSFISPNLLGEEDLCYRLVDNNSKIIVTNPGIYQGGVAIIGNLATTLGEGGNVREDNVFYIKEIPQITFENPAGGYGGRNMETIEGMRKRFVKDINKPTTAVTEKDYEYLVKNTPGLCIHKVKAINNTNKNKVSIVVKPYGTDEFTSLSKEYIDIIYKYIMGKRMITTKIEIVKPEYVPIDVSCVVYTKKHAVNCKENIEKIVKEYLDYVNTFKAFGETINFSQLFNRLEKINGVEYVYNLSLIPKNSNLVTKSGTDIVLNYYCLCYAGNISIDINTVQ